MQGPDIAWYLVVAAILFSIGTAGVLLRRSPLIVLLVAAVGGVVLGTRSRAEDEEEAARARA